MQGSRVRFRGTTKKKAVGLERGPLSLVSTTEELLDRKVVIDYRCRGPGFDSLALQKKVVGLERGPLSLVSTTEELLDKKKSSS
jgi:hypothetical protein